MTQRCLGLAAACLAFCICCGHSRRTDGGDAGKSGSGSAARSGSGSGASSGSGGRSGSGAHSGSGAAAEGGMGATPVDGGYCCPVSKEPGCCMLYGGFAKKPDACTGTVCDGMPSPWENWTQTHDSHGCASWVEPTEYLDCCGCEPRDAGVHDPCDATGTWEIDYWNDSPCSPQDETITLGSGDDGGPDEVTFNTRGPLSDTCSPNDQTTYAKHVVRSDSGCTITVSSHATGCANSEAQCEDLDLTLKLEMPNATTTAIAGTYRKCGCESVPQGMTVELFGRATRVSN